MSSSLSAVAVLLISFSVPFVAQGKRKPHPFTPDTHTKASCLHTLEIIQDPENKTVFLHQSAVFTCEVRGGLSGWLIDGMLLEQLEQNSPEIRDDISTVTNISGGMTIETLTILAKAKYNGTRFQCGVFGLSGLVRSDNATLKIQGIFSLLVDDHYQEQHSRSTVSSR